MVGPYTETTITEIVSLKMDCYASLIMSTFSGLSGYIEYFVIIDLNCTLKCITGNLCQCQDNLDIQLA